MQMLDMWLRMMGGESFDRVTMTGRGRAGNGAENEGTTKELTSYEIYKQFFESKEVVMAPNNSGDMREWKGFEGASMAIIPVMGPLMKADYCGDFGTASLKNLVKLANKEQSVHTILFVHDSPGGTVDGTQSFADAIKGSAKRTISLVDGYCCSADYWIGSASKEIIAASKTDVIGSIGTMCSVMDRSKYREEMGIVVHEFYATASKDKNRMHTEAAKGDGKLLITEMLDPMNDVFLGAVRTHRGDKLNEDALTGKTYTAEKAQEMGLIDGIGSFEQVVEEALSAEGKGGSQFKVYSIQSNNSNNDTMATEIKTLADLKAAYPALVTEAETAAATTAVDAERDRVVAHLPFLALGEEVTKSIEEGTTLKQGTMSKWMVKLNGKNHLNAMEKDNNEEVSAEEQASRGSGGSKAELDAFFKEVKENVSI